MQIALCQDIVKYRSPKIQVLVNLKQLNGYSGMYRDHTMHPTALIRRLQKDLIHESRFGEPVFVNYQMKRRVNQLVARPALTYIDD